MLASVNRSVSWSAAIALLALLPAASGAQEEKARQAGEERWVPSLAVISGATIQSQEASAEACCATEDSPPTPLIPPTDEDDLAASPYVGANLELMSPALPLPGRPRLFLGAEILPTFAAERDIVKEGNPTGFALSEDPERPLLDPNGPPDGPREEYPWTGYSENTILGTGGAMTAEIDTLVFGANLGVAFPFELLGRPLRVKPSFGWIRYKIDVEGRVLKVQCPTFAGSGGAETTACISFDPDGPSTPPPMQPGFTREITLGAQDSLNFNGIGAGLDIEMDTGRVGPFGVSLFLGGRFYRILGDRTVDLSDSATFPEETVESVSLPASTYTAHWSFEVDPWMYRVGLGLRLHWLGSRQ
jgi:hypothetical protein